MSLRATALAVGIAVLAGWSCGGGGSNGTPSPSPTPGNAVTILINGERGGLSFSPNPASVGGQLVVFRNNDSVVHRIRSNDLTIDWGTIQPGQTSQPFRMPVEGTNYHCELHPTMIGAVNPEAGGQPPPCQGVYCMP